jgi:general secretion pathway protein H
MKTKPADGFTLVELMVVLAIAALMAGVVMTAGVRMFDTMQYRDAVRKLSNAASTARYQAITKGKPVDLVMEPEAGRFQIKLAGQATAAGEMSSLGGDLEFSMISAREVSPGRGLAAIRFYPDGGSTGGSISVQRSNGNGVRLRVDWLLGRVSQEALGLP